MAIPDASIPIALYASAFLISLASCPGLILVVSATRWKAFIIPMTVNSKPITKKTGIASPDQKRSRISRVDGDLASDVSLVDGA